MLSDILGSFFEQLWRYFDGVVHGSYLHVEIPTLEQRTQNALSITAHPETFVPTSELCQSSSDRLLELIAPVDTIADVNSGISEQVRMLHGNQYDASPLSGVSTGIIGHNDSLQLYRNRKFSAHEMTYAQRKRLHYFSPIPLEVDTFCDYCNKPVYGLGWGPVCQRCAVCHMTCHWTCKDLVRIGCQPITHKLDDQLYEKVTETTDATQEAPSHTTENGVQCNQGLQGSDVLDITKSAKNSDCGSSLPSAKLSRHSTDVDRLRRPRKNKLAARHSFLAGQTTGASLSARLLYDFSSLDKEAIRTYGICVRDWSPSTIESTIAEHSSTPTAPKSPPLPPQRVSSLANTDQVSVGSTDQSPVAPIPHSSSSPTCSDLSTGFASVIQTTECFVRSQQQHKFQRKQFTPAPPIQMVSSTVGPRNTLPWCDDELAKRIVIFNTNEFGLQASKPPTFSAGDCAGQVRIHINLLRPIRMLLTSRPTSIFDVVGNSGGGGDGDADLDEINETPEHVTENVTSRTTHHVLRPESVTNGDKYYSPPKSAVTAVPVAFEPSHLSVKRRKKHQNTSKSDHFWVPRGSTKILHVHLSTTTRNVISALLERFQIEDNPQKFALYEHTIEGDQEVSVRKLFDDESPLGLLLCWVDSGVCSFNQILNVKRLVLQENETGDIEWTGFSLSELKTFLGILNHEEADYRNRIETKFARRRKEIMRLLAVRARQEEGTDSLPGTPVEPEPTKVEGGAEIVGLDHAQDENLPVQNKLEDAAGTSSDAASTLKRPVDIEPASIDDSEPVEGTLKVSTTQNEQANMEAIQEGLELLTVDQADHKQSKRAHQMQVKQQKKAEKERLKAEKKEHKAAKQRTQGPFIKGFSWFGNLSHTLRLNHPTSETGDKP